MTRIEQKFSELKARGEKGFIPYITAGDPTLRSTVDMVCRLEDAGSDIIELGIPFSDPLADGVVNQQAALRALKNGATLDKVLGLIQEIRKKSEVPLLFFTYVNPVLVGGFEKTVRRAKHAGIDGMLLVDICVEEAQPFQVVLDRHGLNTIFLVTPTSTPGRIKMISNASSGFVYCVSREGVTGMQDKLSGQATGLIKRIKTTTKLPVAVGFGISTPAQARAAAQAADAVVVGSAIVKRFYDEPHTSAGRAKAVKWVTTLIKAVKEG